MACPICMVSTKLVVSRSELTAKPRSSAYLHTLLLLSVIPSGSAYTYFSSNLCCYLLQGGYRGFYARNTIYLTPKSVNDIHKRGGTILGTSRGGHDTCKIVDNIQDRGINQVTTSAILLYGNCINSLLG